MRASAGRKRTCRGCQPTAKIVGHSFCLGQSKFKILSKLTSAVSQCPNCGRQAAGLDGTYDFVGNAITVLKAPQRTLEILKALQDALRAARAGEPEDKVLAHIAKAAPSLAIAIRQETRKGGRGLLTLLILLLLAHCSSEATLDVNQLVDQVHVYMTGAEPYPGIERKETASPSERKAGPNRQQRRKQEHQSKKQKQPSGQKAPQKPKKK
jgi:hypothetical protein